MGLTHVLFSLFLFLLSWRLGLVGFDAAVLGTLIVGSILPDLDHPMGLVYSLFGAPRWLARGVGRGVGQRGVLHSLVVAIAVLVFGCLVLVVGLGLDFVAGLGLFVGFLAHLLLDSLTVRGVAWLAPFSRKRVGFVVGTGGVVERVFFYVLAVVSVVVGYPLVGYLFEFDLRRIFGSLLCAVGC